MKGVNCNASSVAPVNRSESAATQVQPFAFMGMVTCSRLPHDYSSRDGYAASTKKSVIFTPSPAASCNRVSVRGLLFPFSIFQIPDSVNSDRRAISVRPKPDCSIILSSFSGENCNLFFIVHPFNVRPFERTVKLKPS